MKKKSLKEMLFLRIPNKLYKYCSINEYSLSVLINKEIYAAKPVKLNDAFEASCRLKTLWDDRALANNTLPLISQSYTNQLHQDFYNVFYTLRAQPEDIGIYCLSESYKNELLWAYYAENHKGFCIEFTKFIESIMTDFIKNRKVKYSKQNHISLDFCADDVVACYEKLIFTKNINWKHEKEWRIVYEEGDKTYPLPGKISKIIFGCKATDENIKLVMNILKDTVTYERMDVDSDNYKLTPRKIDFK